MPVLGKASPLGFGLRDFANRLNLAKLVMKGGGVDWEEEGKLIVSADLICDDARSPGFNMASKILGSPPGFERSRCEWMARSGGGWRTT